ncbi:MAG: PilN domain-containing protein [Desulfuromonadales bacterium]|nr:PilN domain-containing protein [Desulfuromonadales bacterium]MDW7758281.1 PilN domain-containing protein [Desulfuromonadales bacterium]
MNQEINLYQPSVLEKKEPLSAARMLALALMGLVLLAGYYAYAAWQVRELDQQAHTLEARQSALTAQITSLQEGASRQKSPLLQHEVERLTAELAAKEPLLHLFEQPRGDAVPAFSTYLEGLSRRTPAGLWLTRIVVAPKPGDSLLEGGCLKAETVPAFLQELQKEPAFAGLAFSSFQLFRSDMEPRFINFVLETRQEERP